MAREVVRAWLLSMALSYPVGSARRARADYAVDVSAGVGTMLTDDQREEFGLEQVAVIAAAHAARSVSRWAWLRAGARYGYFSARAEMESGQALAPELGLFLTRSDGDVRPWAAVDVGAAFTGTYVRPALSFTLGIDFAMARDTRIGPAVGYGRVIQWNDEGLSQDAGFLWCGLALRHAFVPRPSAPPPRPLPPRPPPPVELPPAVESRVDEGELLTLIERAVPMSIDRTELLAPVLFDTDQDRLTPTGIAMLHEVARTLEARSDVELVRIEGYADERGDVEYNRALSLRRAENVRAWLVAHGIASARLSTSARGENDPVEPGAEHHALTQNRRVVFRIERTRSP